MKEIDFLEKLNISPDVIWALQQLNPDKEQIFRFKKALLEDEGTMHTLIKKESQPELLSFKLFITLAIEIKKAYEEKGIPDSIYWDSMRDFKIWSEDYKKKSNRIGITEWYWFSLITSMQIFRIGRLQYQIINLCSDLKYQDKVILSGEEILTVHIPADGPLSKEEVLRSFAYAPKFFKKIFNKDFEFYHCESWLLSPVLTEILPPKSNILWFQTLFDIVDDFESTQAEERVFGFASNNPDDYPEKTSLQKNLKEVIKNGKKITEGIGIGRFKGRDFY